MNKKYRGTVAAILTFITLAAVAAATILLAYLLSPSPLPNVITDADPDKYPVIIIDAGHGGEDGGAVGEDGTAEKNINLDVALHLRDLLASYGIDVVMTRTEDILLYDRNVDYMGRKKVLDLRARMKISEENPGAIFVSIHMNSFPLTQYHGLQVWCAPSSPDSLALASSVQSAVRESLQPDNDRHVKTAGSNIYLIHENPNTAILIECGFLSNTEECRKLSREKYRKELSFVIFSAIIEHLNDTQRS